MQSHDGFVYLLPALPANWKEGRIRGIKARGGFELDFCWKTENWTNLPYTRRRVEISVCVRLLLFRAKD